MKLAEVGNIKCAKVKNPWGHTHIKGYDPNMFDPQTAKKIYVKSDYTKH